MGIIPLLPTYHVDSTCIFIRHASEEEEVNPGCLQEHSRSLNYCWDVANAPKWIMLMWHPLPSTEARGSSAGWLQDAADRGSSLTCPRACSPDWTLGNNILHTRVAIQTLKKVKSRFRKSWVILTHTEASSWSIGDPTTQKGKSVPLWRAGVHWSLRGFSAVPKSHTQLQIRHPEARDRISPLPTDLLPVLIFSLSA